MSEKNSKDDELIEYIEKAVKAKVSTGDWDKGIADQSGSLVSMLLYEYSSSIEKLTDRKIPAKQVIDKLSNKMGTLRFGDFKPGIDDEITYDGLSVTSDEYKKKCRIDTHFGAHAITYKDKNGEEKFAIVLFDDKQEKVIDGKNRKLSGIDLSDLGDVRGTIFHEWTHVMEKCLVKASELTKEDIIHKNGDSVYINSMLSPTLSKQEYQDYVDNIDNLLQSDAEIQFAGISTIELNDSRDPDKRIMHNQISEGATEFIARKVMETIGQPVKHPERYSEQVKIIGGIFEGRGLSDCLTTYLTEPYKLIKTLENEKVEDKDTLHYISDYINSSHLNKLFNKCKIDKDGNVQLGAFQKIGSKIKALFSKKEPLMLPEANETPHKEDEKRNEFIESLKVKPEDTIENIKPKEDKNITKQKEDKDGLSLDD
jgi:hypothetical protein